MGKRRIRCLQTLGYSGIFGFDLREDRRQEATDKYGIRTYADIQTALTETKPGALIISVPPDVHHLYMKMAIERRIHFFVEASVVDTDMGAIKASVGPLSIVAAPSATMLFHPAIQLISGMVQKGTLGVVSNVVFHSGQYLPDWHTYEKVSDYYVSNPATGGAREIVPFELTWLTHLFGFPKRVCGHVRKTIQIAGAEEIDDTYNMLFDYGHFLATLTVDVVSRYATRRLLINGDRGQLVWDWNSKNIQLYDPEAQAWETISYTMKNAAAGYNPNIGENMYIEEIQSFLSAVEQGKGYVNNLENDHQVLKLLYAVEEADRRSAYIEFQP
jgi:predicted dehydrogenase